MFLRSLCLICWLDHRLSCMLDCIHVCVFHISKNWFQKLARHLLDTLLSVDLFQLFLLHSRQLHNPWWIDRESSCLLDSFSTLGGSSSFCSWFWWVIPWYLLDTSTVDDLFLDSYLDTSRYLHLSSFTEDLYIRSSRSNSHFFDLSRSVHTCLSPKHYLFYSKPLPLWFFKFFQDFLLLVSF